MLSMCEIIIQHSWTAGASYWLHNGSMTHTRRLARSTPTTACFQCQCYIQHQIQIDKLLVVKSV